MNSLEQIKAKVPISKELEEQMISLQDNMEAVGEFRVPRMKATSEGLSVSEDEKPIQNFKGVLIHTRKTKAFYAKTYKKGEVNPPDCYSLDWITPASDVVKPMAKECAKCPKNEWKSSNTGVGKACRQLRPLYFLQIFEEEGKKKLSPIPQMLLVTPTSLKSLDSYLMRLTQKMKHFRKIETVVDWEKLDKDDTYGLLRFSQGENLPTNLMNDAEGLRQLWLNRIDSEIIEQTEEETAAVKEPTVEKEGGEY